MQQQLNVYKKGLVKLEDEFDMKHLVSHIKQFDKMLHRFDKIHKSQNLDNQLSDETNIDDHFENFIYLDDEYM